MIRIILGVLLITAWILLFVVSIYRFGESRGRVEGKTFAYMLCKSGTSPLCNPKALGIDVKEE